MFQKAQASKGGKDVAIRDFSGVATVAEGLPASTPVGLYAAVAAVLFLLILLLCRWKRGQKLPKKQTSPAPGPEHRSRVIELPSGFVTSVPALPQL